MNLPTTPTPTRSNTPIDGIDERLVCMTVWMPESVATRLKTVAELDHRTPAEEVLYLVEDYVQQGVGAVRAGDR